MFIKNHSLSSSNWLFKHFKDEYVKQAKKMDLRSRAWFKCHEINKKENLFKNGMIVLDLGSSPGGWSKYVITKVSNGGGCVIACDILPMKPINGVYFMQGDLCNSSFFFKIVSYIKENKGEVDAVISDMSPNLSGKLSIDHPKSMYLAKLALKVCQYILSFKGIFLVKIFQGNSVNEYIYKISSLFKSVKFCKPKSSKISSREVYIVAKGYKQ